MSPQAAVWVGAFCLGWLGAVIGAWWLSRRLHARWVSEAQRALEARLDAHARTQIQALREALPALAEAAPAHAPAPAPPASAVAPPAEAVLSDQALHRIADSMQSWLTARLPALVGDALARTTAEQARAGDEALLQALQQTRQQVEDTLQRVPQWVQQAIQVELEFQTQQQAERDAARAVQQQRWRAEQDERRAAELRVLLQALSAQPSAAASPAANPPPLPRHDRVPPPGMPVRSSGAVSARPPELDLTPLPRPEPAQASEAAEPELSDEELDALPPDLPAPGKARKRVLPPPKKPTLRSL